MERQQRPQRPQAPQRPMQNQQGQQMQQQMYNQQMQQQMYNQQMQNMQGQQDISLQKGGKPKKKSKLKIVLIVIGVIILLVAFGILLSKIASGRVSTRVVELEAEVARLEQTIDDNNAAHREEVAKLNQAIADTTVKEVVPTTSLQRVEATQVPEFWLIDGDFIAPNPLNIPNTKDSVNDSFVQIGQVFTLKPSDRWIFSVQGTTYEMSHPNNIWGKIRALSSTDGEIIKVEDGKTLVQSFFIGYPATEIKYKKMFIDETAVGTLGTAQITVKFSDTGEIITETPVPETPAEGETSTPVVQPNITEKKMVVNVGYIKISDYALSFIFLHDVEGGGASQELIELLLRSCTLGINGNSVKLE